ncbi:PREDICTED: uncharacterized protein LOC109464666 isoform X1 [Branchiostoma belcheri]|uniref:Uncharacterized protein LOC109464666 isoform X1 n=2 Tax=Branchiostoma belcheri TaxID=7741 RepID=A0A6P4YET9_BRABE|nr:PREDICTED: uncharacterized protein LOC109464666 isoform X1 [Branchiostoma belcheri]
MFQDSRTTESETDGSPDTFRVRQATSPMEVSLLVLEWAAAEGWHPGLYDTESFYHQDPTGFYLAEKDGVPIGGASVVKYGENFAFLDHVIIKPPFRGKGYARRMIKAVIEASGMSGANIGLDSVMHMQDAYNRIIGVKFAWKNTRFRGVGSNNIKGVKEDNHPAALVSVKQVNFEHLCVFDASVFGTPRPSFLKS